MTPKQKSKQATENASSKRIAWQREALRCKAMTEERDKEIARLSAMLTVQTKNSDEWRTKYRDEERAHNRTKYLVIAWREQCETLTENEMLRRADHMAECDEKAQTPF